MALLVAAVALVVVRARLRPTMPEPRSGHNQGAVTVPRFNAPPARGDRPAPVDASPAEFIQRVMNIWRTAILQKNADGVATAEDAFRAHPRTFFTALSNSARTDENERVRAFSTRMLGMLAMTDAAPLFRELLADPSRHVRGNAAWGLGELAMRPEARDQVRAAAETLRRLKSSDPADEVRKNAADALNKM